MPTPNLPIPTNQPPSPTPSLNIDPSINQNFNREDMLAVTEVWKQIQTVSVTRGTGLTPDECALMVEVTRILRRTNTGPSQAKKPRAGAKTKVDTQALLYGD